MQIQAQTGVHKSMVQIVREAGFRGLYVGLPAIFLRDIPFNMLYFSSYAGFKKALRDENGEVSGVGVFVSGLGAGAIAGLFVFFFFFLRLFLNIFLFEAGLDTPADTIKTRLQNGSGQLRESFVFVGCCKKNL
jgi:solute carrier family 25 aspartate/glutamate transporter 12/13